MRHVGNGVALVWNHFDQVKFWRYYLSHRGDMNLFHDAMADKAEALEEYGMKLTEWEDMGNLDALILAVGHEAYVKDGPAALQGLMAKGAVCVDVKSMLEPSDFGEYNYWSL